MSQIKPPEVWLRGTVEGVPQLLQPVAHALLQACEEVNELLQDFPADKLWERPAGVASVAFHLQHIVGVLDRLFTYAKGGQLTEEQLKYLSAEGRHSEDILLDDLLDNLDRQINKTLDELKQFNHQTLGEKRSVGRKQLPSTVLGLIFHSAEHTMRHLGQLLVTVRVIRTATSR